MILDSPSQNTRNTTNMKTAEYSLRDGSINFEVEIADGSNLYALSQEHLIALANYGLSSWAWRAGAKKSSDGKVFSVAEVAKDLATIKSKDGEPLPDDIKLAKAQVEKFGKIADAMECPDELTGEAAKKWYLAERACQFVLWADAQAEKHGFEYETNGEDVETFAPRFMRLRRLAIARNVAKAAKAGLSDLD